MRCKSTTYHQLLNNQWSRDRNRHTPMLPMCSLTINAIHIRYKPIYAVLNVLCTVICTT